ncbi:heptaprenyl diphosphate synthase [Seinonella peptonophila]|uniref:Heptaprenyl diphosphate synthase n=1 Tax=Seinonella peptonophila TaxID=112248 RepID=A0A1M4TFU1_9BACL|nr:polyprenyl synthetase family protein [Seinonella peptonophila]SHE43258.1 heptaprenyl diphosphate synthase [Seinonella peptonophila]
MNLQTIYRGMKKNLREIETGLFEALKSDHIELQEASHHLLHAGGKRIRPVFVLLSGQFGSPSFAQLKSIAIVLELIHMATLVHDDVIDNAETRRGKPTVKAKWDNRIALLSGDYILACALQELCKFQDQRIHRVLSHEMLEMCRGEIEQIRDLYQAELTIHRYLQRIKRKTALLIMVSCQLGAMVSQTSEQVEQVLRSYGYYIGMAFQMIDDILDFTGTDKELGKPAGSDLKTGNVTLPVIYALKHLDPVKRKQIVDYLAHKGQSDNLTEVLEIVKTSGGIEFANQLANRYLHKALAVLDKLPKQKERDSLQRIAEFIVKRTY